MLGQLNMLLKKIKQYGKVFFCFSTSESDGLLAIVVLIFLCSIVPRIYKLYTPWSLKVLEDKQVLVVLENNLSLLQAGRKKLLRIDINTASVKQIENILKGYTRLAHRIIRYYTL